MATVFTLSILDDNYSYLIICNATKLCAVVDPADPGKVQCNLLILIIITPFNLSVSIAIILVLCMLCICICVCM